MRWCWARSTSEPELLLVTAYSRRYVRGPSGKLTTAEPENGKTSPFVDKVDGAFAAKFTRE